MSPAACAHANRLLFLVSARTTHSILSKTAPALHRNSASVRRKSRHIADTRLFSSESLGRRTAAPEAHHTQMPGGPTNESKGLQAEGDT